MSRDVVWAPKAMDDLLNHLEYIAEDSIASAEAVRTRILKRIGLLAKTPAGRQGRVAGTYETFAPKTSVVICFELPEAGKLHVLRIIHTSRDWPKGSWPADAAPHPRPRPKNWGGVKV